MKRHYAFLDGMRGLAALFVVVRHTPAFWGGKLHRSYLAVDLFFILSGFVIGGSYDDRLRKKILSPAKFLLVRWIRLYPAFLISVFLAAVASWGDRKSLGIGSVELGRIALLTALFIPSRWHGSPLLFSLNAVYWSLFYEVIVNALYAVATPLLTRNVLVGVVFVAFALLAAAATVSGGFDIGIVWSAKSFAAGAVRAMFGIFAGLVLQRFSVAFKRPESGVCSWLGLTLPFLVFVIPDVGTWDVMIDLAAVVTIFPTAILLASQEAQSRAAPLLLFLGAVSYPIYVLHLPLSSIWLSYMPASNRSDLFAGVVFLASLLLIAAMIERWWELPVRRFLARTTLR